MFEDSASPSSAATPQRSVDRRRAATRDEILAAAWELCREHGLAGLSLRDLAERVGMRAPSLYSYVASKDDIYDLMFAQGQREMAEALDGLPGGSGTREHFRRANHVFFRFCVSDAVRYQLMFQRTLPGFVPSNESYELALANLQRLADELRAAGATDPRHVDLWTAIMTGLTDQQLSNDPGGDRWERLLDETIDMFCDHVGIAPTPDASTRTRARPDRTGHRTTTRTSERPRSRS